MKSFFYIIYYFLTGKRSLKKDEMKPELIKGDIIVYGFYCSLTNSETSKNSMNAIVNDIPKKLECFVRTILNAVFIHPTKKERIEEAFYKAQKVYHGMSRLARHFKMKHSRVYDIQHDLCLNSLDELKENMKYRLYDDHNRTVYNFRISDLITLINTALMHSPEFFADPQPIRNPYTNLEFTTAQLYSLYFAIKQSPYIMPLLFQQYFMCEFNLLDFCKANECYIREQAIKSFVRNATLQQKYRMILKMFVDYKRQLEGIVIHNDFPKKTLVEHFSKYLHDYLLECYSLNPGIRHICKRKLKGDLLLFKTLNPTYGRKIRTYGINSPDWSIHSGSQSNHTNTFIFGNHSETASSNQNSMPVYSFVDNVITQLPRSRDNFLRRRQNTRQRRREQRNALMSTRRTPLEQTRAMNELLDSAFSLLRRTDHQLTGQPNTQSNIIISTETSNSDDAMDIDLVIDALNSDETSLESDSELQYQIIEETMNRENNNHSNGNTESQSDTESDTDTDADSNNSDN